MDAPNWVVVVLLKLEATAHAPQSSLPTEFTTFDIYKGYFIYIQGGGGASLGKAKVKTSLGFPTLL